MTKITKTIGTIGRIVEEHRVSVYGVELMVTRYSTGKNMIYALDNMPRKMSPGVAKALTVALTAAICVAEGKMDEAESLMVEESESPK